MSYEAASNQYMLTLASRSVTLLTESNYHTWKNEVQMVFRMDPVMDGIIQGTLPRPQEASPKESTTTVAITAAQWDAKDRLALTFIWSTMSKELTHLVLNLTSGSAAWKALKAKFEVSTWSW